MNTFKMRYFFLVPTVVLAMVACAKRDSDFARRATEPVADKAVDKTAYKGDLKAVYQDSCKNLISMDLKNNTSSDIEKELTLDDVVTKEKGSYVLQSTELYVDRAVKDSKINNQLFATGSHYELPKDFVTTSTDNGKIVVVCHTVKADEASAQNLSASLVLPYAFSTLDGSVPALRQDKIDIDNKAAVKTTSVLYSQDDNLEKMLTDSKGKHSLVMKHTNGDITINTQVSTTDEKSGTVTNVFMSGTYSLKK